MLRKNRLGFDQFKLAALARDLAMGLKDVPDVLKDYGITEGMVHELEQIPFFQQALQAALLEWNGPLNTKARVELASAALVEKGLTVLGARMTNKEEPLNSCVDVGRFLAKLAGIGEKQVEQSESDRVVVTINLGADQKLTFDKAVKADLPKDVTPEQRALEAITKNAD
jgi:hypothetical protein